MVMTQRTQIEEAMSADFGVHPTLATDLIEVLGVAGRAAYVAEQLEGWMTPEPRYSDPAPAWSLRCARCWSSVRTRCAPAAGGLRRIDPPPTKWSAGAL